ncbi:MAG: hypothetical protein H7Y13_03085 [Sphingobacteriaceae bacterium]|nr:hypothetical protein [Sphingobacteriaceae bacterium]
MTKKQFLILTAFAIFALTSCNQSDSNSSTAANNSSSSETKTKAPKNEGAFDNPNKLCATLSQNGIGELKEWKNPMEMGWGSLTDYYQFGPQKDGVGMQNNIAYYLEGTETAVSNLTINLNINNSSDKKNALKFLADVTEKTFVSLSSTVPTDLTKAILASKDYKGEVNDFEVSNELEKSKLETWKVIIKKK